MNVLRWAKSLFFRRDQALALYRRGMGRAEQHDHHGAIEDYSAAIGLEKVPADVKAMALFNRALAHGAAGDDARSMEDLQAVLAMEAAPANVKDRARQKLMKRETRLRNSNASGNQ
jgi:hypothetical protein